jgi:monoamine oxidase
MDVEVAIIGAGLSGLYAARELQRRGISFVVLEGRDRIAGRILSVGPPSAQGSSNRYDLGPAWFWPDMQPRMSRLVAELGLTAFSQHTEGAVLVERFKLEPVQRYERGVNAQPRSMRLKGGMQALADAMAAQLPSDRIRLGVKVADVSRAGSKVEVVTVSETDRGVFSADKVILALPPRVAATAITFSPSLPDGVLAAMRARPTWMAGMRRCSPYT